MRTLSIEAASRESAYGLRAALVALHAEVLEPEADSFHVRVELSGGGTKVVAILNALQQHVIARQTGPALIELDGQTYMMET